MGRLIVSAAERTAQSLASRSREIALLAVLLTLQSPTAGQDTGPWLTGPALARRLAEPTDLEWQSNATLRDSLGRLSRAMRVAIVLDRRIDPGRELALSHKNTPLGDVLKAIAEGFNERHAQPTSFPRPTPGIAVKEFASVVYLGPKTSADNLRTIAEVRRDEVRKLPAAQADRLNTRVELRWGELATPRQIVEGLAKQAGVAITSVEELVPHDHWPAGSWPAMSLVERLTLLAVQFDLTFRVEAGGKQLRLVKLSPEDTKLERTHTVSANAQKVAEAWRAACPDAEIRQAGNRITVRGRLEDHEWLANPASKTASKSSGATTKGRTVHTLTIKNEKLGAVIRALAKHLNLTLKMDEAAIGAAGIDLEGRIEELSVKDASTETLLQKALPRGLRYRIQGGTLEISPSSDGF